MRSLVVAGHVLSVFVSFHVGLPLPQPLPSGEEWVIYPITEVRGGTGCVQLSPSSQSWDFPDHWKHTLPSAQG